MAINKEKKSAIISKLEKVVNKAKNIVFVNFHGLTVAGVNELRKNLRDKNISYFVAKKTLIKKVFNASSYEGELPTLDGEVAVAYFSDSEKEDPILPAKEIYDFQKKNAGVIKIIGGVFEGKYANSDYMLQLAKIPGQETLRAQFVNVINSPIQGWVMVLDAMAKKKEEAQTA